MRILRFLVVLVIAIAPVAAIAQLPVTRISSPVSWVITPADLTESTDIPPALPTGGVRRKSNTTPGWTATAVSSQVICNGGEITFTAPTGQVLAVGLSIYNTGPSPSDLEHSIRFSASTAKIYFGATLGPSLGTYTPTTQFTIRRNSALQIEYLVDGQLKHTTSTIVVGRLQADCSLNTAGAQITSCSIDQGDSDADGLPDAWQIAYFPAFPNYANIWPFDSDANPDGDPANNLREFLDGSHPRNPISYLNPVTWAAPFGAELPDSLGSIRKTSTSLTWDVSATSKDANTLEEHTLIEDGKLTFRAVRPPSSTTVTPLLAVGFFPATNLVNTAASLADLPYAIVLSSNGTAAARRPGADNTSLGEFNSDTSFSIERVNGIVTFIKDGVAFPVSSTPLLSGPLHIKCRLYKPGTELTECRLYTGDLDLDKLPDAWETTYLTPASPDSGPTLIDLQNFLPSSPSPLTPDPANPDLDSLNNFQEYRDGTHPLRQLLTSADVLWLAQPASNVTFPSPTTITKATGTPVAWDTDAIALYAPGSTAPLLLQESGKLAFSVSTGSHLAVGLTFQNNNRGSGDLEYSIIVTPQGTAAVYSGTTNVKSLGRYNSNTRFIIRRLGGRIDFLSDNVILHSVLLPTAKRTLPLIVDNSLRTPGSSIVDARLYTGDLDEDGLPDTWEITHLRRLKPGDPDFPALDAFAPEQDQDDDDASNAIEFNAGSDPLQPLSTPQPIAWKDWMKTSNPNPAIGSLRKISRPTPTTSATWNADAISTQTLQSDGSVSFTASPTGNLAVGLTTQNTLRTVADLEYAFVLTPTAAAIRRPETTNLATGPFTSSTVFTLRRAANVISFLRDGVTLYTSTVPTPAGSHIVDCSILQFDHQIDSAYIHDAAQDLDGDLIPDAWELAFLPPDSTFTALQNDFAPYGDSDKDGLNNAREFQLGTDPTRSDTDGDGLPDAWEVEHGSDPLESDASADADGDGISNQAEKKADETIPPGPTYIFTSERIKTGSFEGEAGHKLGEHETIQTNVTPYWALDVINPAYQAWLQDMSDRQNGDADDQNNNTDPGDPRDEYHKANPPQETIEEKVDEDTDGAITRYDEEDTVTSTEEYLITFTNPKGTYTADYGPNTILPSGHSEESNAPFSDSKLTQKIDLLPWGKPPSALTHGWRGDGKTGVQSKKAHTQWTTSDESFVFEGDQYTHHTTSASAKHIQVRLQASKPITAAEGLSRSFILVKTTTELTPGNTTPPVQQFIGTVILTIPEGKTISASAGGTAGSTYLKYEQDIAYVELRPTTFTENKRIDLNLLPVELRSGHAENDGKYAFNNHDHSLYPRPGNVAAVDEAKALENALHLYFEDCTEPDQIVARPVTHFDLKVGTGNPLEILGLSWQVLEKPPESSDLIPNEPKRLIRSIANNNANMRGGLYRFNLTGASGVEPQAWLPLAGPDITVYWESEIAYFRNAWGPAYRSKLNSKTLPLILRPNLRNAAKRTLAINDMRTLGQTLDWSGFPKGSYSPCGGPNRSGDEFRLTISGVVIDFRKRNNMMYALIGREMSIPETVLFYAADPKYKVATGSPDTPQSQESYRAGFDLHSGLSLGVVMRTRGRKMQEPGSWARREWPSWEAAPTGLIRVKQSLLQQLIN
jgi:hypothetical protein